MAGRVGDTLKTSPAVMCMKTLMMIFNIYFFVSGLAILALGIWVKVDLHKSLDLTNTHSSGSAWLLIGVGLCIILVGIFGCCCTIKGISSLLYVYGFALVIIFLLDVAVAISAFVFKGKIEEEFEKGLRKSMSEYSSEKETQEAVDELQQHLKCCGSKLYTDWFEVDWEGKFESNTTVAHNDVPPSCCKKEKDCKHTELPAKAGNGTEDIYTDGCQNKVSTFMEENFAIIGGVALAFCVVQLLGAVVACCLAKHINKNKYEQVA